MNQFIEITNRDVEDPPREPNWDLALETLRKLRGVIRRTPLTKASRKRWNKTLGFFERGLKVQYDEAVEEYPIKMEQLLGRLKSIIERVKSKEVPVREAWAVVSEANSFFQRTLVKSPVRASGVRHLDEMVRELKVVQNEQQLDD